MTYDPIHLYRNKWWFRAVERAGTRLKRRMPVNIKALNARRDRALKAAAENKEQANNLTKCIISLQLRGRR